MLVLNNEDRAALHALVQDGVNQAANSLSQLVGQKVGVEIPYSKLLPVDELEQSLEELFDQEIVRVHQVFRGKLAGDSIVYIAAGPASILVDMLNGGKGSPHPLGAGDREALLETGNILIHALIASFGNLLGGHILFTEPHLDIESRPVLPEVLSNGTRKVENALLVPINMHLPLGQVAGYAVILMDARSFETLLAAIRVEGSVR